MAIVIGQFLKLQKAKIFNETFANIYPIHFQHHLDLLCLLLRWFKKFKV